MFLVYLAVWIILNGKITTEIIAIGVIISTALYAFSCRFMDYSVAKDLRRFKLLGLLLIYFVILLVEIFKANLGVIHLIMSFQYEPEPILITFRTDLKTEFAKTLLANSITLTPGTITVSLEENEYKVHCLDKSMADGMECSVFVKSLQKMERMADKWKQK